MGYLDDPALTWQGFAILGGVTINRIWIYVDDTINWIIIKLIIWTAFKFSTIMSESFILHLMYSWIHSEFNLFDDDS